jgi:transposase-like protein
VEALVSADGDYVRAMVQSIVEATLEAEMTSALGTGKGERAKGRSGYRSGYYTQGLTTRVGTLELRVPRDRDERFSTRLFERYQRSEKALVGALSEMYMQGVSTRKVKAVTEELCGYSFSASAISQINKRMDAALAEFAGRRLEEPFAYLIVDARYGRVRAG